jgi:phytoene desaturase
VNPVVVIGAGLAGLSAACYLTGRGYDVTVVEREALTGDRAGVLRRGGFTFDTGPTVLTMPDLIADAVRAACRDPSPNLNELLPMRRLDAAYRACFADGSTIHVRYSRKAMREEIAQTYGSVDAAAFDSFVDWLRRLYPLETPNFIDRNYDSPLGHMSALRALAQLIRLGVFGRPGHAVRRRFTDPRLHRLFSFHNVSQTGPFRPSNVERRLPGMFFAGSGTVPGVGVPMVLTSGKLVASRVAAYLRAQQT